MRMNDATETYRNNKHMAPWPKSWESGKSKLDNCKNVVAGNLNPRGRNDVQWHGSPLLSETHLGCNETSLDIVKKDFDGIHGSLRFQNLDHLLLLQSQCCTHINCIWNNNYESSQEAAERAFLSYPFIYIFQPRKTSKNTSSNCQHFQGVKRPAITSFKLFSSQLHLGLSLDHRIH